MGNLSLYRLSIYHCLSHDLSAGVEGRRGGGGERGGGGGGGRGGQEKIKNKH